MISLQEQIFGKTLLLLNMYKNYTKFDAGINKTKLIHRR